MRNFLISLLVSVIATIFLWQFGLWRLSWSRQHPVAAMLVFAVLCGVLVQAALTFLRKPGSKRE